MSKMSFNPVNFLVSMTVGWFVMSFLHAAVRSLLAGSRGDLVARFKAIALLQDRPAALLNLALILGIGIVTGGLWFALRRD